MSYSVNQYNYCTPLSSAVNFTDASYVVEDVKYFTLFDNVLDGTYRPVTGYVGIWSSSLSDDNGVLTEPIIFTAEETLSIPALSLIGSAYAYPVAFTVQFYNGDTLLHTLVETENNKPTYLGILPNLYNVTKIILTVTQISSANSVLKLYNAYPVFYVKAYDVVPVIQSTSRQMSVKIHSTTELKPSLHEESNASVTIVTKHSSDILIHACLSLRYLQIFMLQ